MKNQILTYHTSINQLGGVFLNGRPLPAYKRRMMVELASEGVRPCQISRILQVGCLTCISKVSNGCVSKILGRFQKTGLLGPKATGGSRPRLLTPDVIGAIMHHKHANPAIFAWEIREKLLAGRPSMHQKIPSVSSINRILRKVQMDPGTEHGSHAENGRLSSLDEGSWEPSAEEPAEDPHQAAVLEQEFLQYHYPDMFTREMLASQAHLPEGTITVKPTALCSEVVCWQIRDFGQWSFPLLPPCPSSPAVGPACSTRHLSPGPPGVPAGHFGNGSTPPELDCGATGPSPDSTVRLSTGVSQAVTKTSCKKLK
uniref:Paired domain-containing protein n=1 Tax=Denticeps clupeoides TaxID=299321 RepID=A0AAY4DS45_9TELE